MNFNMTQVLVAWAASVFLAVWLALGNDAPDIPVNLPADGESIVLEAARTDDKSAQVVAGQLVELLMDPEAIAASQEAGEAGNSLDGANSGPPPPQVSAILFERGNAVVYVKGQAGGLALAEGGEWNGWTVERIEPDRVYFTHSGEKFDFLAFAAAGQPEASSAAPNQIETPAERRARKKKAKKRETEN